MSVWRSIHLFFWNESCFIFISCLNLFFVVFHWMNNKLASVPAMALAPNKGHAIGLVYWRVNAPLGLDGSLYCEAIGFSCMFCDQHVYLWNIHLTQFRVHVLKQTKFPWVSCVNFLGSNVLLTLIDFTLRYVIASMELKLIFSFLNNEQCYILWMQELIICLWESMSFNEAEASSFWRGMTSLGALGVVITKTFGVPGAVGFNDVSFLVFWEFGTIM